MKRIQELDPKRAKKWNLLADPRLEPGECRVKAGDHEVDAGCQGRLAACMEQVREGLSTTDAQQEEA
jgi:flagellar assembly protein FliH